ncbi:hypothetical protein DPMN_163958 [Dreissena polymorpha]|uniref:Uncharacterized protein n=1 Tax=Dreissena polymorpha TaxID=45954 RepID=A0A9D4EUY5_DREPO|nr:hypothetical protein DPMN_163958 [Dreissena polymorpha]
MSNGFFIGKVHGGDTVYEDFSSEITITEMKQGDEVYVQHHEENVDNIQVHPTVLNSFTGVLLQIA